MRQSRRILLSTSAALAVLTGGGVAAAHTTDEPVSLGELVVTAQKRSESIQDVPAAVTAVSAQTLADRGISTPTDLQFVVPSMQAGNLLGQTAFTIRGVGLNQGSPGVALHVDGVYQPRPSMGSLTQTDIARVEVLRGPQGTLYGRNANGGAINFITEGPRAAFEGYVLGSYATYDDSRLQGVINVPLGDRVRTRLVVDRWERGEGFVKNVLPDGQDVDRGRTLSGRLRLQADLLEDLTFDLGLTGLHGEGPTSYFTLYNVPTAAATAANPYLVGAIVPLEPRRIAANDPIGAERDFGMASGAFTWNLGDFQLKSISSYQRLADHEVRDDDSINVSAFPSERYARSRTVTHELNLSGDVGPVSAVIGAFYMRDSAYDRLAYDFRLGIAPLPAGSQLVHESIRTLTKSKAIFGDATWRLTDRARIVGGVRFSEDKLTQTQRGLLAMGPTPPIDSCPLRTNEVTYRSTTPRIGAQFDITGESNVYATFSKGFKSGGWNIYSCANGFSPEKLTSYEAGWKNRFFQNTVILNASAFYYDYTDLQLSQVVGLVRLIRNAAAAKVKGVELESAWRPNEYWTINANAALLDAKFTDFTSIDALAPQLGAQDVDGNRLANAPKASANLGVAYRTDPLSIGGTLTARADVSYRSKVYFREFNGPLDGQKGYSVVNAALIWDSPDEAYRVRLFANNLFGEDYIVQMDSSDNFGSRYVAWGAPRQVGVELRANF